MDVHADLPRHEASLRAVQKPPTKPWRGTTGTSAGGATPIPPPKVYRVEPREFRDLVQRLTGAPPTAARHHHQTTTVAAPVQPVPVRAAVEDYHRHHHQQQQGYAPWFSFPMAAGTGMDNANGGGGFSM